MLKWIHLEKEDGTLKKIVSPAEHLKLHKPGIGVHCHRKDGTICKANYPSDCLLLCGYHPQYFPPRNQRFEVSKHFHSARMFNLLFPCDSIEFTPKGKEFLELSINIAELEKLEPMAKNISNRKHNLSNLAAIYYQLEKQKTMKNIVKQEFLETRGTSQGLLTFMVAAELLTRVVTPPIWLR